MARSRRHGNGWLTRAAPRRATLLALALALALPGTAAAEDGVRGDFNGDGRDDAVITASFEDVGANRDAGAVHVLYGPAAAGSQMWTQGSPGVPDAPEPGDRFGAAAAAGDFDADG